ncbi:OsmC family protein [Hydrogenophaga sp. PBL-H3]|uniref:OsmC family protein n=1 Tax=Hydrogenophaga sp. PBL-H3 TaxID=434010 RepID=UPI00131F70DB|nr:OsmC family protein [Hydrogenophaga sp. PBL-H3]QHE77733.1 OsmC family protein [Hydrogenophaga sp. PBL-H3]QHE82157.1 OsmC family protein [Hydrogenophaga sp. PBL-H3]
MTTVSVSLAQQADYRFEVDFGAGIPGLMADEPPPLGKGEGPAPAQLLCAAVGNCLSDSLLFALRKFKQAPEPIRCEVQADVGRNPEGRLRILGLHATVTLGVPANALQHLDRALAQFEEFCTVTQSVRQALPVRVTVLDVDGLLLRDQT